MKYSIYTRNHTETANLRQVAMLNFVENLTSWLYYFRKPFSVWRYLFPFWRLTIKLWTCPKFFPNFDVWATIFGGTSNFRPSFYQRAMQSVVLLERRCLSVCLSNCRTVFTSLTSAVHRCLEKVIFKNIYVHMLEGYLDFSYLGLFVPWTIRTIDVLFVPWTVRTVLDCSYHGLFVPSLDFSYPGLFVSWTVHTLLDCSYHGLFVPSLDDSYRDARLTKYHHMLEMSTIGRNARWVVALNVV